MGLRPRESPAHNGQSLHQRLSTVSHFRKCGEKPCYASEYPSQTIEKIRVLLWDVLEALSMYLYSDEFQITPILRRGRILRKRSVDINEIIF
jgi:hypothetical protein